MHREIREVRDVLRDLVSIGCAPFLNLHAPYGPSRKQVTMLAHPVKTPQNSLDSVCPLLLLPFKCCSSVELGTSNQKSQVSLFQPFQPQKGECAETCGLPPEFGETSPGSPCPDWPNHRHPQEGACWYFSSSPIPLLRILIERLLFYLLFPNFSSLLQRTVLTLLSAAYIVYRIHLFCHLIFACELSFSKSDFAQKHPICESKRINERIKWTPSKPPFKHFTYPVRNTSSQNSFFWWDDIFSYNILSFHYPRAKQPRFLS